MDNPALRRSNQQIEVFFILFITVIVTFSSSALSFNDQFCSSTHTRKSRLGRARVNKVDSLQVATEIFDSSSDSSVQANEIFSRGEEKNEDVENSKHILTFQSSFQRESKSRVQLSSEMDLDEFFLHTDRLLSAGKSVHSKIIPKTSELLEEWTMACDRAGACLPNKDKGVIMSVRTAGISIPGLSVEWSALIGTNLVHRNQNHYDQCPLPELEFVLIKDETTVSSGAKPIIWIYNKLTQKRSKSQRSKRKRRSSGMDTKLFTRLGFYKYKSSSATTNRSQGAIDSEKNDSFVIRCDGVMEMKFRIPSMLGKLVFSSNAEEQKAKAERNVSNLITRQIEKDTEQNVMRWEESFLAWANEYDTDKS